MRAQFVRNSDPFKKLAVGDNRPADQWDNIEDYITIALRKIYDAFPNWQWGKQPFYFQYESERGAFEFDVSADKLLELLFIPPENELDYDAWGWCINDFNYINNFYEHGPDFKTGNKPIDRSIPETEDVEEFIQKVKEKGL